MDQSRELDGWRTEETPPSTGSGHLSGQSVVAALPTAAVVLDDRGRVVAMNDGMATLLGTTPGTAAGREYRTLVADGRGPGDDGGFALASAALETPHVADEHPDVERVEGEPPTGAVVYESRCSRRNERGEEEPFVYTASPLLEDGSPRGVLLTVERCGSERETYPGLVGVLSHDLRNLLNVVMLFVDRAAGDIDENHYDPIRQNLERMERLVEDALALAEHADSGLDREVLSLSQVATHAWVHVDTGRAELVTEDARIEADETSLLQLLENLFRNSLEHGSTGSGSLTVRVGPLECGGFYVEDTGRGIPEDERSRVFEHGYTTSEDGTGMGLSIVHVLVRDHGWEIEVTESAEGGARFEITGPARR